MQQANFLPEQKRKSEATQKIPISFSALQKPQSSGPAIGIERKIRAV
jgi:hypothetical protein